MQVRLAGLVPTMPLIRSRIRPFVSRIWNPIYTGYHPPSRKRILPFSSVGPISAPSTVSNFPCVSNAFREFEASEWKKNNEWRLTVLGGLLIFSHTQNPAKTSNEVKPRESLIFGQYNVRIGGRIALDWRFYFKNWQFLISFKCLNRSSSGR